MPKLCRESDCVALATVGDYCTVHAQGYRVHTSAHELRCRHCRRTIARGEVYIKTNSTDVRHARPCKESRVSVREREEHKRGRAVR